MRTPRLAFVLGLISCLACGGGDNAPTPRIPDYSGNWSGTYTVTGCTQSGQIALANVCGLLGNTPPYRFNLTQSDRNVSGTFTMGSITFPNTGGTVAQDGSLAISATTQSNGITVVVTWALNMPASSITGTLTQNWSSAALSGSATVAGSINNAIRGAAVLAPTPSALPGSPSELALRLRSE